MKPCATCSSKGIECAYESQYLRGRPPTPPLSTPDAIPSEPPGTEIVQHQPALPEVAANEKSQSLSRSSPELDTAEINGQYVDRTSGLSFLQRARSRLKRRNAPTSGQIERSDQPLTAAGDKPLLNGPTIGLTILPTIPGDDEAAELFDLYFDVCVATYKPLHRPTVDSWYRAISGNVKLGLPMTKDLGNARVSTVLSVFAVTKFHRQKSRGFSDDVSSLSDSDAFFRCAMALTEAETGGPHLESAQARLIQVFYLLMTCRMNQAWYIFGNLLQIISALGMHRRDRKRMLPPTTNANYLHSQCRRRIFWSAYILDKYVGVVMGRPRHFHDKDIDQDYPDRVNDENVGSLGPTPSDGDGSDECQLDGFIWNIKLARIVGEISDDLYAINPWPEARRIELARGLAAKLDEWHASLPALLKAKPTSLSRCFRRQCVALKLAYKHAVVHLHRPFLLIGNDATAPTIATQQFRRDSIALCLSGARDALHIIDALAREGPLFHALWWTHYITFCALSVIYVWNMQSRIDIDGIDREALMTLAGRCQVHLAHATATNSPSRRYSIILEELRSEAKGLRQSNAKALDNHTQAGECELDPTDPNTDQSAVMNTFEAQVMMPNALPENMAGDGLDLFMDWQTSDWLELDASVSTRSMFALRQKTDQISGVWGGPWSQPRSPMVFRAVGYQCTQRQVNDTVYATLFFIGSV